MKLGVGIAGKQLREQGISQGEMKKTIAAVRKCWLGDYSIVKIADIAKFLLKK